MKTKKSWQATCRKPAATLLTSLLAANLALGAVYIGFTPQPVFAETETTVEAKSAAETKATAETESAAETKAVAETESTSETESSEIAPPTEAEPPAAAETESPDFEPFIRIDRDDPEAYSRDLENLRILTEGEYELGKPKDKYGIDPDFVPDLTGLDTLNVSASAQFNERQFHELADTLRTVSGGKEIYVFDLRRECHVLLDGLPFSVYDLHNWSNLDLSLEEIEAKEQEFFGELLGTTFQAFAKEDDNRGEMAEYQPEALMTEKELVESEGFHYIRIPVIDHS